MPPLIDHDPAARDDAARRFAECAGDLVVRAVMSEAPVTVTPGDSLTTAYERLSGAGVHHLPVVDSSGRPVGMIDAQVLAETWPPSVDAERRRTVASLLPARRPDCVHAEASLRVAAVDMHLGGTDAVCVVDAEGRLVGILTARDVVAAVAGRSVAGP